MQKSQSLNDGHGQEETVVSADDGHHAADTDMDEEELVPGQDMPENQALHKVDDNTLKFYGIKKRGDLGVFVFAKNTSPWAALTKMDQPEELSTLEIIANHVRNGQLTWKPRKRHTTPKGWQLMPELPTSEELRAEGPPTIPESGKKAPSKVDYLERQYLLYRLEGIELLRRAVAAYRTSGQAPVDDAFTYTQVHIQGLFITKVGVAFRVSFSTELSGTTVIWQDSDRLTPGTIVALSTRKDRFQTICRVAVVASRQFLGGLVPDPDKNENENTPPRIDIFWADPDDAIIDPSEEMVMIEARGGYYEAVRHAMVGLQHAALHVSKLDRYLIDGSQDDDTADYVAKLCPEVPQSAETLDHSQVDAFHRMTSKEVAIVQGPPGTGKTFTSIVAIESLIKAFRSRSCSIIVSAQTNHALDQLLGECIKNDAVVARLGGRSQDEENDRTMYSLRQESKVSRSDSQGERSQKRIVHRIEELLQMCFPGGLISADTLFAEGILSEKQYFSLRNEEWESVNSQQSPSTESLIENWLGESIEKDMTYVYTPPTGQTDPAGHTFESDVQMNSEEVMIRDSRRCEDDEKDRLRGQFVPIMHHWTGTVKSKGAMWISKAAQILRDQRDLYQVKPDQRGMVYRFLRQQLIAKVTGQLPEYLREHQKTCENIKIARWVNNVEVLKHEKIQVVGCTTTGLTKYRGLLAALKPKVLLIEEAAETREPNITSAIFPTLDQLILVGDHQQLVPHVDVRELGSEPYNLNVSLFERLITNLPFCQLQVQRRMIPVIRKVVQTFYPMLQDHAIVKDPEHRPPVPGIDYNMWWFQHDWPDVRERLSFSFINIEEAKMIVGFTQYLTQNGLAPNQITILTFYSGQVDLIRSLLSTNAWFRIYYPAQQWANVVRTVDGFQGEQNDVVLLSVVRSCPERPSAGFVENENRAVVALSRAKRGLYVFGNDYNLLNSSQRSKETWGKVLGNFSHMRGRCLPVTCKNHGDTTEVRGPDDWVEISGGGCRKGCRQTCPNGHPCEIRCHCAAHSDLRCQHPCDKVLPCGHSCVSCCSENCRCAHRCNEPNVKNAPSAQPPSQRSRISGFKAKGKKMSSNGRPDATRNRFRGQTGTMTLSRPPQPSGESMPSSYRGQSSSTAYAQGQGQPAQSQGSLRIRETFRRTITTSLGRVVDGISHQIHDAVEPREEEDLIDLRDEVMVNSSADDGGVDSKRKEGPSSELLIDFSD